MWSLIGDKLLIRKLRQLHKSSAYRATKAGGSKAMQIAAKAIKRAVPAKMKAARKGVGWKAGQRRGVKDSYSARAGVGVGIKRGKFAATDRAGRKGVGIGPANFHWVILPNPKLRTLKSGQSTGRRKVTLPNFVSKAVRPVLGQMRLANRKGAWASIKKDVARGKAY
jgi:hypothetical protein